jgi:hypothetical protein
VEWYVILGCGLLGVLRMRIADLHRRGEPEARKDGLTDALIGVGLWIVAWYYYARVAETLNPNNLPYAPDSHDFLECSLAARFGEVAHWVPHRYPLYPSLVAGWSVLSDKPLFRAGMQVAFVCSSLVPVAAYVLGRVLAPRPLAFAGALLVTPITSHLAMIGAPTDYPLWTLMFVLSVATLIRAIQVGTTRAHLVSGIFLALYGLTSAKAFPLTLMGLAAVVGAQVLTRRFDRRALLAWGAPLLCAWMVFAFLHLPIYSLENNLIDVQLSGAVRRIDPALPFPNVGWLPNAPMMERGYWVPGRLSALIHLPQVFHYLLAAPLNALPQSVWVERYLEPLALEIGASGSPWMVVVAVVGGLGAWKSAASSSRFPARSGFPVRPLVAAGFACGVAALHLWGMRSADFTDRWALPQMVSTPMYVLGGLAFLAGRRDRPAALEWRAWAPLLVAVLWTVLYSPNRLALPQVTEWVPTWVTARQGNIRAFLPLFDQVSPGDAVVDATETALARVMLDSRGLTFQEATLQGHPTFTEIRADGDDAARRWIVLECVSREDWTLGGNWARAYASLDADPARFRKVSRCIYEDLRPSEALLLPPDAAASE